MTRQSLPHPSMLTSEQREEYDTIVDRGVKPLNDGSLGGPMDAWLLNPRLGRQLRELGVFLWEGTSLDRGLLEMAISITGRLWESNFEWFVHSARAVQHGVPQSVIDEVFAGRRPVGTAEQELLYDVCASMTTERRLPLVLYDSAVETFGERGLLEIMTTIGYYALASMTLNAFEVRVPDGVIPAFVREP